MRHAKYFIVGVLYMTACFLGVVNIIHWWPWPLVIPAALLTYICGRGISGGFSGPTDQDELDRQNANMRRGGGMVE